MHHEHADHAAGLPDDRAASCWSTTRWSPSTVSADGVPVIRRPASDMAVEVGHVMAASMVMIGAYAGGHRPGGSGLPGRGLDAPRCPPTAPSTPPSTSRRSGPASIRCAPGSAPAWPDRRRCSRDRPGDGHHPGHPGHRCRCLQGLRPVHRRLPARRAGHDRPRRQRPRLPVPPAAPRVHRLSRPAPRSAPTSCSRSTSTTRPSRSRR